MWSKGLLSSSRSMLSRTREEVIREHLMGDDRAHTLEAVISALAAQKDTFD